jgi:transcriptional regulator with XRE-family HTH domain
VTKTFGQRIRELRQEKELSLREFAQRLGGITAPYLSDIELGRRYPSETIMEKMAQVLEVTVEELRTLDPRPPVEELKRRGERDPKLAAALRRVVDQDVSGDELAKLLKQLASRKRGGGS